MDACLAGNIPIYSGWFDEYDSKIFNKNRILFYDSNNPESIQSVFTTVHELMNDKDKLATFYKQPVFMDCAYETVQMLQNDFVSKLKSY